MLLALHVRDFVIVEECQLNFDAGFTVFSGETGAGKSILIDALSLTLGAKGDADLVRQGAARADISAVFATSAALEVWLTEHDVVGDAGTVILRRVLEANGKSKASINGIPCTQTLLRECADFLVDIHGQHAHQLLLKTSAQRQLLDEHAGLGETLNAVTQAYKNWQHARQQYEQAQHDSGTRELERERLQWQFDELSKLAPTAGEWQHINQEHTRLSHAARLLEGAQHSLAQLSGDDASSVRHKSGTLQSGAAVQAALHHTVAILQPLAQIDPALNNALEALQNAQVQINDAASTLNQYLSRTELDPQRLTELDTRLQALHSAARKYRVMPEQLPETWEKIRQDLKTLESASDLNALQAQQQAAYVLYEQHAQQLSLARQQAATQLSEQITAVMQTLNMAGGQLVVTLSPRSAAAHGLEDVEFFVAAHPGVEPRPLAKTASGGELARISLAIAVITAHASATPTLIFDEVDSGIGGAVAEIVGQLLRQLGKRRQVLCVTHLAQVAAQGQQHFVVGKTRQAQRTVSQVQQLNTAQRVEEIARMLGGVEISATTRAAAQEMLQNSASS